MTGRRKNTQTSPQNARRDICLENDSDEEKSSSDDEGVSEEDQESETSHDKLSSSLELRQRPIRKFSNQSQWNSLDNNKSQEKSSNNVQYHVISGSIICIIIIGLIAIKLNSGSLHPICIDYSLADDSLKVELKEMKNTFKKQDLNVWKKIYSSVRSILRHEPRQPSTLLLMHAEESSQKVVNCIASRLGNWSARTFAMDDVLGNKLVNSELYEQDFEKSKIELDKLIKKNLGESHAVSLLDIDKLHGSVATILHSYCDNDNAPFKDAIIILTMGIPEVSLGRKKTEEVAENYLKEVWSEHVDIDKLEALLSRIVVSAVNIVPEHPLKFSEMCNHV